MNYSTYFNRFLLSGVFIFICLTGFSQPNWQQGYIINQLGNQVNGYIENSESANLLTRCTFRKNMKTKPITYTASEIQAVKFVNGKYYVSKKIDSNSAVFVEFIYSGSINLYILHEKKNRFFIEKDEKLVELLNSQTVGNNNGIAYINYNKEYVNVLNDLLKDADIENQINATELQTNSLIALAQSYQQKINPDKKTTLYDESGQRNKNDVWAYTGISMHQVSFGGITKSNYAPAFSIGCSYEYTNYVLLGPRVSFRADLSYLHLGKCTLSEAEPNSSSKITYNGEDYTISNKKYTYYGIDKLEVDLKAHFIRIPLTVNFYIIKEHIPVYIGAGFTNFIVLSYNKDFIYTRFENELGKTIPTYQYGLIGRLGTKYLIKNRYGYFAEVSYELNQTLDNNQNYRLSNRLVNFHLGYIF